MKCIKVELPREIKQIELELFFDAHIGSRKHRYDLLKEKIDRVKNNDNVYAILGGDLINNSILGSVAQADLYESELSPMEQIKTAIRLFEPIKDKIIAVTSGNHERRTMKQSGLDLMYLFCDELGLTDRYDYASAVVFLRFGELKDAGNHKRKVCYTIHISHGDGIGGKLVGAKANGLQKRGQMIDSDIVIVGHTHQPLAFYDAYFKIDYQNSKVHKMEQLLVNAGATLDYEQYAEIYGMRPSSTANPVIVLDGVSKKMYARL